MPLEITPSKLGSISLLALKGTVVMGADTELLTKQAEDLVAAGESKIVLDLAQVTYVDSTGIGTLIRIHSLAKSHGGVIKLVNLTKRIYDVLQITRLSLIFEIYSDVGKALASFEAPPAPAAPDARA